MKNFKFIFVIMALLVPALALAATPGSKPLRGSGKVLESGMEGPFYGFYLGNDLKGHVKTKLCESEKVCKEVTIKITPDVRATLDGQDVPLQQFVMSKHQPTTLHISTETKKLSRISWLSSNK